MDRDNYNQKINLILLNINIYQIINRNPTKKLINELHNLRTRWKKK